MLNNKQRRELLTRANEAEFPGSILDVFRGAEQGRDLINEFKMSQGDQMAVASTPEEQNRGLRPFHNAGRTDMSMAFTDVPPNTPFNTVGMKKPIDIKTYDRQGHLVKSYDAVPPGMTGLSSGPNSAYAVERPAKAQSSVSPYFEYNTIAPVDNTSTAGITSRASFDPNRPVPEPKPFGTDDSESIRVLEEKKDDLTLGQYMYLTNQYQSVGSPRLRTGTDNEPLIKILGGNISWDQATFGNKRLHTNPGTEDTSPAVYTRSNAPLDLLEEMPHSRQLQDLQDHYGEAEGLRQYKQRYFEELASVGFDQRRLYHTRGTLEYEAHNDPNVDYTSSKSKKQFKSLEATGSQGNPKRMGFGVNAAEFLERREQQRQLENRSPLFFGAFPEEEPKAQSEKVKGQSSVSPVNYLLDTLAADDPSSYAYQQQAEADKALRAEQQRVEGVRANVLSEAKKISEAQSNLNYDDLAPYRFYQDTSSDMSGSSPQAIRAELMRRQEALPDSIKQVLPDEGRYNVFNLAPDAYSTNRQLYCTPYGCLPYQKAGATDVPIVHSNPKFRSGARSGELPFQSVPAAERQPGDIALQVGNAPVDYGRPELGYRLRPHHTTIYTRDAEESDLFYKPEGFDEQTADDPVSIMAYNARGGVAMNFDESPIQREDAPLEFYRYVGQTPQMQQTLEARQRVASAIPLPTVEPLKAGSIPTNVPAQQLQTRTTSPDVLATARRRRRPRFRRV